MAQGERTEAAVIAGGAALVQRTAGSAGEGEDAIGLMVRAARAAAGRAPDLLSRVSFVAVPQGTWRHRDPGRLVAEGIGASENCLTLRADVGVLQTSVLASAIDHVERGHGDVALVVGGEALDRRRQARRKGVRAVERPSTEADADVVLRPTGPVTDPFESEWGLTEPVVQYALAESARAHRLGLTPEANRRAIAELYAEFSAVAGEVDSAWESVPWTVDQILDTTARGNRGLAFPYSGMTVSRMYIDQAAAVLVCRSGLAEDSGVPLVRVAALAESHHAVPLAERVEPGRNDQWRLIADALERGWGRPARSVDLVDLYSCFPVAVALQAEAFGLPLGRGLTLTGSMSFGGGGFNHAALHALARATAMLGAGTGESALVTANSGYLTKQGAVVLTTIGKGPVARFDVSAQSAVVVGRRSAVTRHSGPLTVEAATVEYDRKGAGHTVVLGRTDTGAGSVARGGPSVTAFLSEPVPTVGQRVEVADGRLLAG